jgi:hypothetical protein
VPYDDWTDALFGVRLSEVFGWHRNHFDRLVHTAYGSCFGAVVFGHLHRVRDWRPRWAAIAAVAIAGLRAARHRPVEPTPDGPVDLVGGYASA